MTEPNHTPEPWKLRIPAKDFEIYLEAGLEEGAVALGVILSKVTDRATQQANADRIVACVNACAGMNPTAITHAMRACKLLLAWRTEETSKEGDAAWRLAAAQGYLESAEYEARLAMTDTP